MISVCAIARCEPVAQSTELLVDLSVLSADPGAMPPVVGGAAVAHGMLRCRVNTANVSAAVRRGIPRLVGAHVLMYADAILLVRSDGVAPADGGLLPVLFTFGVGAAALHGATVWQHLTSAHVLASVNASKAAALVAAAQICAAVPTVPLSWQEHIRFFTECQLFPQRRTDAHTALGGVDRALAANPAMLDMAVRLCTTAVAVNTEPPWRCGVGVDAGSTRVGVPFVTWRTAQRMVSVFCEPARLLVVLHHERGDVTLVVSAFVAERTTQVCADVLGSAMQILHAPAAPAAAPNEAAPPAPRTVPTGRRPRRRGAQ